MPGYPLMVVILEFIIRNVYLVFVPVPATEFLKPLNCLSDQSNRGDFWKASRNGARAGEPS